MSQDIELFTEIARQIIKTYKQKQERINNLQSVCNHDIYQFKEGFDEEVEGIYGHEWCPNCALVAILNLCEMVEQNGYVLRSNTDYSRAVILAKYFTNCLQYPSIARFILNQTNLWNEILYVLNSLMNGFSNRKVIWKMANLLNEKNEKNRGCKDSWFLLAVINIIRPFIFEIMLNIGHLRRKHWNKIFKNDNGYIYCINWLVFIEKELKYDLLKINNGFESLYCFVVLICVGLHRMKHGNDTKQTDLDQLDDFKRIIKRLKRMIKSNNKFVDDPRKLFILFTIDSFYHDMFMSKQAIYDIFWNCSQTVYDMKRENVQCYNMKCNVRRMDQCNGKLFKCKSCKLARYCSKRCQKIDWNINNHKIYCEKLKQFATKRNNKTEMNDLNLFS